MARADDTIEGGIDRQRLDKWLWFARIVRTRALAQALISSGHSRVNSQKARSADRLVGKGDILTIGRANGPLLLLISGLAGRRGPASQARLVYEDISPPATAPDMAERTDFRQ